MFNRFYCNYLSLEIGLVPCLIATIEPEECLVGPAVALIRRLIVKDKHYNH